MGVAFGVWRPPLQCTGSNPSAGDICEWLTWLYIMIPINLECSFKTPEDFRSFCRLASALRFVPPWTVPRDVNRCCTLRL